MYTKLALSAINGEIDAIYRTRPRKPRDFQSGDEWAFLIRAWREEKTIDREEYMFYTSP
jgi:hypothetical protein